MEGLPQSERSNNEVHNCYQINVHGGWHGKGWGKDPIPLNGQAEVNKLLFIMNQAEVTYVTKPQTMRNISSAALERRRRWVLPGTGW